MQLYAFDTHNTIVHVSSAHTKQKYSCIECSNLVCPRGGRWRARHFFHLTSSPNCRLAGKSLPHLKTQMLLKYLLQPDEVWLEHAFPQIGRIADVVWPCQKVVFEIQCSPISAQEVAARNRDYFHIGYTPVWILHDRRFNRYQSTAAEEFLRHFPHYFTNVNGEGKGIFYDQYALMDRGRRIRRTSRFSIHPKDIIRAPFTSPVFQERHKWPIRFQGDACHQVSTDSDLQTPPSHPRKKGLFNFMRSLIHVLLEDIAE